MKTLNGKGTYSWISCLGEYKDEAKEIVYKLVAIYCSLPPTTCDLRRIYSAGPMEYEWEEVILPHFRIF
jgi:hypothetical protein